MRGFGGKIRRVWDSDVLISAGIEVGGVLRVLTLEYLLQVFY